MGYSGPRRLRSSAPSIISRFPRHSHLLRGRLSRFFGQCAGEGTILPERLVTCRHLCCFMDKETGLLIPLGIQWISEVLHFCQGLPIILVGCKKDLRYDQKTIEELHKTSQKPVTPEQVRLYKHLAKPTPQNILQLGFRASAVT